MSRVTRKFVTARLVTTTTNMVAAGTIPAFARFGYDQTGSDRHPWNLVLDEINPDNSRSRTVIVAGCTWAGLNNAVDALYELSWVASRMADTRQGH